MLFRSEAEDCSVYSIIFRGLASNLDSLLHFRSFDEFANSNSLQATSENDGWLSGLWDRNGTNNFIPKNLIKNINNTDRDLLYYGVTLEGDFSQNINDSITETEEFFSANGVTTVNGKPIVSE